MKITLLRLVALLFCAANTSIAQTPPISWTKAIGGTGNERANGITTDADGNVIIVGRFQSNTMFLDDLQIHKKNLESEDLSDIFIVKLDPNGKVLWALAAGDEGDDHALSCVADKLNNIYVVGWFESKILKLGNVSLQNKTEKGCDMFVAKLSPKGEFLWAQHAGGEGSNGDYSTIALDNNNNVIIAGIAGVSMDFGDGTVFTNEKNGIYVAKYTNNGKLIWAKSAPNGECQGVGTDHQGNIFIGGYFEQKSSFDGLTLVSNGKSDAFITKYSPSGKVLWAKNLGGEGGEIASCETDAKGNAYLGGLFFSDYIAVGTDTLKNKGMMNAFVVKYDGNGNVIWSKSAGGNNGQGPATAIREFYVDDHGNAFCTGSNWSEFVFANQSIQPVANSEDIFILKYNTDGSEAWAAGYGGTGRNAGRGIASDQPGNVYLTGSFDEKELKIENHTLKNKGDSDIFIVKYSAKQ